MENTKLHELLVNLSGNEFSSLSKFIISPYHNNNEKIITLYRYISDYSPGFTHDNLNKQNIFRHLYPNEPYKEKRVDLLFSDLKSLIESFLLIEKINNNTKISKTLLLNIMREKGCKKNFSSLVNELTKTEKNEFSKTFDFYYDKFIKEYELSAVEYMKRLYSSTAAFQEFEDSVNLFTVSIKLISFVLIYRHQKELAAKINYNIEFEKEIEAYIRKNISMIRKDHPGIYSSYLILMTFLHPAKETYFKTLKKYVIANISRFKAYILKDILNEMTNYCNDRVYLNTYKYSKELFDIYEIIDKYDLFLYDKYIEQTDFINPVITALVVNNRNWAHNFFNKYKNNLQPEIKTEALALVRAELFFSEKKYEKALKELSLIKSKMFYFYLRTKVLRIKIYYELNEDEAVSYIIDSVKHYLARNKKIDSSIYNSGMNYLNYIRKLIICKTRPDKNKITNLINQVVNEKGFASTIWLIEKLNELKKAV